MSLPPNNFGPIKVLTVYQPYASALVACTPELGPIKRIETRPYRARHAEGPFWLAIHAGKLTTAEGVNLFHSRVVEFSVRNGIVDTGRQFIRGLGSLPRDVIVGLVRVCRMRSTEEIVAEGLTSREQSFGDFSPDRWGWEIDEAIPFDKPLDGWSGRRALMPPGEELEARIVAAARENWDRGWHGNDLVVSRGSDVGAVG